MKRFKQLSLLFFSVALTCSLGSCSDDDDAADAGPVPTGNAKVYSLDSVSDPTISGTATFTELNNGTIDLLIDLQNTQAGDSHPSHIHMNTAAESGAIVVSLEPVDGDTGLSRTIVNQLDDGTPVSLSDILDFDGYINVHLSMSELSTLVAQGDIGENELTGQSITYDFNSVGSSNVTGTAEFAERNNETTLVTLDLVNTVAGVIHPAHIHENDAITMGPIIVGLTGVDGDTGMSKTQVEILTDGTSVSYSDLLTIDAYINIHESPNNIPVVLAQVNIGSNQGMNTTAINYDVTNSGASAYIFDGNGLSGRSNPDITLVRGMTYTFTVTAPGHPFYIKSVQGTGTANSYDDGVTNNGTVNGTVTFTVPSNAPDTLFYNCQFHGVMTGTITITN